MRRKPAGGGCLCAADRFKFDIPDAVQIGPLVDEMKEAAANPAHGGNIKLPQSDRLGKILRAQRFGPRHGLCGVPNTKPHVTHARPMVRKGLRGMTRTLTVDDDVDRTLPPQRHPFGAMIAFAPKRHCGQNALQLGGTCVVNGKIR